MDKLNLITRNLQEILGVEELKQIVEKRSLKIYWGTAITGKPHIGYFVPIMKISDFLKAGCEVKILLADLHGYLDAQKSTWEQLEGRYKFYSFLIKEVLKSRNVPIEKLTFVKGSDFQLDKKFTLDMYRVSGLTSIRNAQKAGSEVVKQTENPEISGLLYPILQVLDEQYLDVDAQFGGMDQRKIFVFAQEVLPKIGYKKRIHLMNPMVAGLTGTKMSSSEMNSKIDFLDDEKTIQKKINKANSVDGVVENNGVLAFLKHVIFPIKLESNEVLLIDRPEKYGGNVSFSNYDDLERSFKEGTIVSADIKPILAREINLLLNPIRLAVTDDIKKIIKESY